MSGEDFSGDIHQPTPFERLLAARLRVLAINEIKKRGVIITHNEQLRDLHLVTRLYVARKLGLDSKGLVELVLNEEWELSTGFRVLGCLGCSDLIPPETYEAFWEYSSDADLL